jgi:hypothetical protein
MADNETNVIYRLRDKYTCKSWNSLSSLSSSKGWLLPVVEKHDNDGGAYLQSGDVLYAEQTGADWDLRIERNDAPLRTMRNIQLQGLDGVPGLWAKVSDEGHDVYLYLLDAIKSVDGEEKRQLHVDVFYPNTRYNADRPGPGTVTIL